MTDSIILLMRYSCLRKNDSVGLLGYLSPHMCSLANTDSDQARVLAFIVELMKYLSSCTAGLVGSHQDRLFIEGFLHGKVSVGDHASKLVLT